MIAISTGGTATWASLEASKKLRSFEELRNFQLREKDTPSLDDMDVKKRQKRWGSMFDNKASMARGTTSSVRSPTAKEGAEFHRISSLLNEMLYLAFDAKSFAHDASTAHVTIQLLS